MITKTARCFKTASYRPRHVWGASPKNRYAVARVVEEPWKGVLLNGIREGQVNLRTALDAVTSGTGFARSDFSNLIGQVDAQKDGGRFLLASPQTTDPAARGWDFTVEKTGDSMWPFALQMLVSQGSTERPSYHNVGFRRRQVPHPAATSPIACREMTLHAETFAQRNNDTTSLNLRDLLSQVWPAASVDDAKLVNALLHEGRSMTIEFPNEKGFELELEVRPHGLNRSVRWVDDDAHCLTIVNDGLPVFHVDLTLFPSSRRTFPGAFWANDTLRPIRAMLDQACSSLLGK